MNSNAIAKVLPGLLGEVVMVVAVTGCGMVSCALLDVCITPCGSQFIPNMLLPECITGELLLSLLHA